MATRKIIGIIFSFIAVLFSIIFIIESDININLKEYFDYSLKSYFSLSYFNKILPLSFCLILLYGSILLVFKPKKSNAILALFGFTILEQVVCNWFGLISINYPTYIVILFSSIALLALWIAYSGTINKKHLSLREGIYSLIFGTLINILSFFY